MPRRVVLAQRARPDVTLDEGGVLGEVLGVERGHLGRTDLGLDPLEIDLAVAGDADGQGRERAVGVLELDDDVLQRVGRGPVPRRGGAGRRAGVDEVDERLDGRRVGRVDSTWAAGRPSSGMASGGRTCTASVFAA